MHSNFRSFTKNDLSNLEKIYRINLINSLSGYKSANLIGTISPEKVENVAIFSSVIHLGSNPALLGFIVRPDSVPRNTYSNIKKTGVFTVNHIVENIIEDAHHTSAKYDENISEFEMTKLTPEYINDFKAPFVKESPVKIALKYVEEYLIKANNTIMVIGEIQFFCVESIMIEDDGFLNLAKVKTASINGLDGYAVPNLLKREAYQKPKTNKK